MTHAEMMHRMSISEFHYWAAYHANRVRKEQPVQEQTPEQMLATLDVLAFKQKRRSA